MVWVELFKLSAHVSQNHPKPVHDVLIPQRVFRSHCCHTLGSRHLPLRIGNASPGPFLTGCMENKVRRLPCPFAEIIYHSHAMTGMRAHTRLLRVDNDTKPKEPPKVAQSPARNQPPCIGQLFVFSQLSHPQTIGGLVGYLKVS